MARVYGGTKLGVGGLIAAYKETAKMTLESASIIEKTIDIHFTILFTYINMNKVMRIIKEKNLEIISQQINETCKIEIVTRKKNANEIEGIFNGVFGVEVKTDNN